MAEVSGIEFGAVKRGLRARMVDSDGEVHGGALRDGPWTVDEVKDFIRAAELYRDRLIEDEASLEVV